MYDSSKIIKQTIFKMYFYEKKIAKNCQLCGAELVLVYTLTYMFDVAIVATRRKSSCFKWSKTRKTLLWADENDYRGTFAAHAQNIIAFTGFVLIKRTDTPTGDGGGSGG